MNPAITQFEEARKKNALSADISFITRVLKNIDSVEYDRHIKQGLILESDVEALQAHILKIVRKLK